MIRILIITDLEGISCVRHFDQIQKDHPDLPFCCQRLAADTNACIRGCFDGGADEVLVVDGHGGGHNFPPDSIDPRAKQVTLREGEVDMTTVTALMHVGAHAMSGTQCAFIDHTQNSIRWHDFYINGRRCGELAQSGYYGGYFGVPYIFVSGDEAACQEARQFFGPVATAAVKYAVVRNACECMPAEEAETLIYENAKESLSRIGMVRPLKPVLPMTLKLTFNRADYCDDVCALRDDLVRIDARTVVHVQDTITKYLDMRI